MMPTQTPDWQMLDVVQQEQHQAFGSGTMYYFSKYENHDLLSDQAKFTHKIVIKVCEYWVLSNGTDDQTNFQMPIFTDQRIFKC